MAHSGVNGLWQIAKHGYTTFNTNSLWQYDYTAVDKAKLAKLKETNQADLQAVMDEMKRQVNRMVYGTDTDYLLKCVIRGKRNLKDFNLVEPWRKL